jgi:ferredoxin
MLMPIHERNLNCARPTANTIHTTRRQRQLNNIKYIDISKDSKYCNRRHWRSSIPTACTQENLQTVRRFNNCYTRSYPNSQLTVYNRTRTVRMTTVTKDENYLDPKIQEYLSSLDLFEGINDDSISTNDSIKLRMYIKIVQSLEAVYGKGRVTLSHLQSFGISGLKELLKSIIREEAQSALHKTNNDSNNPFVIVRFKVPHHSTEFDLPWYYTTIHADQQAATLLYIKNSSPEGAELLAEYIEASCGGNCSCSTCHVYIDTIKSTDATQSIALSNVSVAEQDMLDLAYEPTDQSRLACQVRLLNLPSNMVGQHEPVLTVTIPSGVNNFWN